MKSLAENKKPTKKTSNFWSDNQTWNMKNEKQNKPLKSDNSGIISFGRWLWFVSNSFRHVWSPSCAAGYSVSTRQDCTMITKCAQLSTQHSTPPPIWMILYLHRRENLKIVIATFKGNVLSKTCNAVQGTRRRRALLIPNYGALWQWVIKAKIRLLHSKRNTGTNSRRLAGIWKRHDMIFEE